MSPWDKMDKLKVALKKAKKRGDEFAIENLRTQIHECEADQRTEMAGQIDPNIDGMFGVVWY
jgi:uncharacterized membrane protein (DUF106 family)